MPRLDYECLKGHIFEDDYRGDKIPCQHIKCKAQAEIIWLSPRSPHRQLQTPIVMWRYPDGRLGVAGGADSRTPKGAERVEIRSIGEYRKHAKELNQQLKEKEEKRDERYLKAKEYMEKKSRSNLSYLMGQETDPAARDLYRVALERDLGGHKPLPFSDFYSIAMEMDKSNYD